MKMRIKSYTDWRPSGRQTQQRLGIRIMQADQQARADLLEVVEAGDVPIETPSADITSLQPANPNANSHSHSNTSNDIFYYHTNHLGSTAFVTDANATVTQGFLYAPFGEITTEFNVSFGNDIMPKYASTAKELDEETGMYYYEARYYAPPVFTSRDPMFEKYFWMTPYAYCANNPVKYVDPTGMDWYETEDGNIEWTDCKNQAEMNKEGIKGNYLGEAFMDINGSRNEKLGTGNNLFTEGAVLAKATVYGPKGENDIQEYDAFTMSSDFSKYGAIADGNYNVSYRVPGKTGALKSNWAVNDTRPVDCLDGKNPNPGGYSSTQKNGIYIHRSNNDGSMLPKGTPVSTGCIIIVPSRNGNNGWNEFNKQLSGVSAFTMRLKRD